MHLCPRCETTLSNFEVNQGYKDITDISRFNINGAVGLSAGFGRFFLRGQYIYGFTNILGRLNDKNLNIGNNTAKFKGNQSMLTLTVLLIF